jgi:hypothetical protein
VKGAEMLVKPARVDDRGQLHLSSCGVGS